MKSILTAVIFIFSFSSFSQVNYSCLTNSTNQQLLNEISRRMSSSPGLPPSQGVLVNLVCDGFRLNVSALNLDNGVETKLVLDTDGTLVCNEFEQAIGARLGNRSITQSKVFAVCDSFRLQRVMVAADGVLKKLTIVETPGSLSCRTQAKQINDNI